METDLKELGIVGGAGIAAILAVALQLSSFSAALLITLCYAFFIYLPVANMVIRIKGLDLLEKIFLSNLAGMSYAAVYVICDVVFKIPLTKILFVFMTIAVFAVSFFMPAQFINKLLFGRTGKLHE